jgi:hypothetical protein
MTLARSTTASMRLWTDSSERSARRGRSSALQRMTRPMMRLFLRGGSIGASLLCAMSIASGCSREQRAQPGAPRTSTPAVSTAREERRVENTTPPAVPPTSDAAQPSLELPANYRAAGCTKIHPWDLGDLGVWGKIDGVICEIPDAAPRVPDCDVIAKMYRRDSRPAKVFGVVVSRRGSEGSECQGAYGANAEFLGDLPSVD